MRCVLAYAVFNVDLESIAQIFCCVLCSELHLFLSAQMLYSVLLHGPKLCLIAALVSSKILNGFRMNKGLATVLLIQLPLPDSHMRTGSEQVVIV
ncbi:hypothetical protein Y032_0014g2443 [Ancylostoma ceylanicum]|uniref:Uncharacterized protein n=1 Tax=Ancylostoma ceylanicum TaxID=53326 RepID=A0A016VAM1_9BILA|nr:hypothetical protein Y032_0014g2443 [Ancylostoma ceylanicum]